MMKKFAAAVLFSTLAATTNAFAGGTATTATAVTLADGYTALSTTAVNVAKAYALTPIASRAGFIKNPFEVTLSANVIAGLNDNAANSRMGVIAGSNKGYNVYTGSSVGGSVTQCGTPVAKTVTDLAASAVVAASLVMGNDNACGRN